MENSFKSMIDKSKSILILLPTKPRLDQVSAGLSLFLLLKDRKQIQISSPTPMTVGFNKLVGVNKITQDLGNKNLVVSFAAYKANDIEKVSYDIENGQFQLTVIPKQNINPPTKDQVKLSYSGLAADTVTIIGGANESHFPAIASNDLASASLIHIGTRDISLPSSKSYISFSRPASSVSEVVYSLIKEGGMSIDSDIATNLLMGIEEGSNGFTANGVSAETFAVVAELMRAGGKRPSQVSTQKGYQPTPIPRSFPPRPPSTVFGRSQTQQLSQDDHKRENEQGKTPKDWLEPKIFKGTSIS
jgi:hypothetical protein